MLLLLPFCKTNEIQSNKFIKTLQSFTQGHIVDFLSSGNQRNYVLFLNSKTGTNTLPKCFIDAQALVTMSMLAKPLIIYSPALINI